MEYCKSLFVPRQRAPCVGVPVTLSYYSGKVASWGRGGSIKLRDSVVYYISGCFFLALLKVIPPQHACDKRPHRSIRDSERSAETEIPQQRRCEALQQSVKQLIIRPVARVMSGVNGARLSAAEEISLRNKKTKY